MKIANATHEARPWILTEVAPDHELLDVWQLPVHGAREDFSLFLEMLADVDPSQAGTVTRLLFAVRHALGSLLRWDDAKERTIPGSDVSTLAACVPAELEGSAEGTRMGPFTPLYRTDDEWAAELSNETVHGIVQFVWVEDAGGYGARMAIYVKPRGSLGRLYMKLIEPFRHFIVYPALMRYFERAWAERERPRQDSNLRHPV